MIGNQTITSSLTATSDQNTTNTSNRETTQRRTAHEILSNLHPLINPDDLPPVERDHELRVPDAPRPGNRITANDDLPRIDRLDINDPPVKRRRFN